MRVWGAVSTVDAIISIRGNPSIFTCWTHNVNSSKHSLFLLDTYDCWCCVVVVIVVNVDDTQHTCHCPVHPSPPLSPPLCISFSPGPRLPRYPTPRYCTYTDFIRRCIQLSTCPRWRRPRRPASLPAHATSSSLAALSLAPCSPPWHGVATEPPTRRWCSSSGATGSSLMSECAMPF